MGCRIGENRPLLRLRRYLKAPNVCHSSRGSCVHRLERAQGAGVFGIPGAAIGYCQALFSQSSSARDHTLKITEALRGIGAPWAESHEVFWGHRSDQPVKTFLDEAMAPLRDGGRVPIVITSLNPTCDSDEIEQIVSTVPELRDGETILLRLVLHEPEDALPLRNLLRRLVDEGVESRSMPRWWPLLQGAFGPMEWREVARTVGDLWPFVNIAVNPFTIEIAAAAYPELITVGQVVVGEAAGIGEDGYIAVPQGMNIMGATDASGYNLKAYAGALKALPSIPTLILLGPSQANWTDSQNAARVNAAVRLLRTACGTLWHRVPPEARDQVWRLSA